MKILYFIAGTPDEAEKAEAARLGALLRNGGAWHEGDCLEICDQVMGKPENVPPPYRCLWKEPEPTPEPEKPAKRRGKNAADS